MSVKFGFKPQAFKEGKIYVIEPSDANFEFTRPSPANRINEDGNVETMAVDVPRIDYNDPGCPKLVIGSNEKVFGLINLSINANSMVWEVELEDNSSDFSDRVVALSDTNNSFVSIGYVLQDQIKFEFIDSGVSLGDIIYQNCNQSLFRTLSTRKSGGVIEAKSDGVLVGYESGIADLPTMIEMSYSYNNASSFFNGKVRDNTVDDDVTTFDSKATSYAALDSIINNYTIR